jgi:hypothetical protein
VKEAFVQRFAHEIDAGVGFEYGLVTFHIIFFFYFSCM